MVTLTLKVHSAPSGKCAHILDKNLGKMPPRFLVFKNRRVWKTMFLIFWLQKSMHVIWAAVKKRRQSKDKRTYVNKM